MAFIRLISLSQCRPGSGLFVETGDLELAVFVSEDESEVVVTDNSCPHSSGNLSAGEVRDGLVICPLHHWEFDACTGRCVDSPKAVVKVYESKIEDGFVCVRF